MLISASRRTDIPALYADWFMNRLRDGYAVVSNPVNPKRTYRIELTPDVVDGIVFWTKNPLPMLEKLHGLSDYAYYFQFTLTPYGADVEPNVPDKDKVVVPAFQRLADRLGPERVMWRYDPIFLNDTYTLAYHLEAFYKLSNELNGYSNMCIISFLDDYKHIQGKMRELGARGLTDGEIEALAAGLSESARAHGMALGTCAEKIELSRYGIGHARCIDKRLFEKLTGYRLDVERDKAQRPDCGCDASIDIGAYNTCSGGCLYCYANHSAGTIKKNLGNYDVNSTILCSRLDGGGDVTAKQVKSNKTQQTFLSV